MNQGKLTENLAGPVGQSFWSISLLFAKIKKEHEKKLVQLPLILLCHLLVLSDDMSCKNSTRSPFIQDSYPTMSLHSQLLFPSYIFFPKYDQPSAEEAITEVHNCEKGFKPA